MKRAVALLISVILFISMLVLGVVSRMQAQQNQQGQQQPCTLATLQETYGFSFTGFQQLIQTTPPVFATTASFPSAVVGIATFNGAGFFSAEATASNNGTISSMTASGAYTVNPDCTGSTTIMSEGFTSTANILIVDNGKEIQFIMTNTGAVQTGVAIKAASGCTLASLQGTYGTLASGFFQFGATTASHPFAQIGNVSSDGAGHATGQFTFSDNGNIITNPAQMFTYTVNPDCTGSVPAPPPNSGSVLNFVIVAQGHEFLAIQTVDGTVVSAIGIKQ